MKLISPNYIISHNNLFVRIFVQGLLPIFPIITKQIGANKFQNGLLLSFMYTAMLIGTILAGKIAKFNFQLKNIILIISIPLCCSLLYIGFADNYYFLLFSSIVLGFCCGMYIMSHFILLGKFSDTKSASKNFSFIAFSSLLSTVIGSTLVGFCIKNIGLKYSFVLFASVLFLNTFTVFLLPRPVKSNVNVNDEKFLFQKRFIWLLMASLLAIMCIHIFGLTISLSLSENGIPIYNISYYSAIGTMLVLWFPLWFGRYTNENTVNRSFIICLIAVIFAFIILFFSKRPYEYILAVTMMSIMSSPFFIPVMQQIFLWHDRKDLPMAQSWYTGIAWLGAILGYILTGSVLQLAGFEASIFIGTSLAICSLLIVILKVK